MINYLNDFVLQQRCVQYIVSGTLDGWDCES
nr:MAG TPA: hypothetical protein [Caudoviricetes sp.]